MKINFFLIPALLCALLTTVSTAQTLPSQPGSDPCATGAPSQQWEAAFQSLIKELKTSRANMKMVTPVITIPVIVHVIHGGQLVGAYPNLDQSQIQSQIRVLNYDFGGVGFLFGKHRPELAQSLKPRDLRIDRERATPGLEQP